ncbi:MAG: phosphotransferase family protein [Actinobacteria bacterium]|nr:phosphotransferase family protein [Actinomycetota bacterium]
MADEPLAAWLADLFGGPAALSVATPTGGGWSNDTLLCRFGAARVVVRVEPARRSMFPTYDLGRQVACLRALAGRVPVPELLDVDLEGVRLGRPAFVMAFVEGRVPADDRPTFAEAGWLHDASLGDQRRFFDGLLGALVEVHATPVIEALRPVGDANVAYLDDVRRLWEWDRGDHWPTIIEETLAALEQEVPPSPGDVLLWGDARPANVVAAGFDPVALLDWELASVGPAEHDLAWLAEMNHVRIEGAGHASLPGFRDLAGIAATYAELGGRRTVELSWYQAVAAVRVAVLMHRYLRAMVHAGQLPEGHRLLGDTVASRRLACAPWDSNPEPAD